MSENYFLGIDIGSVSISIVKVNKEKKIVQSSYLPHEGQLIFYLKSALQDYNLKEITGIAVTSSTPEIIHNAQSFDNRVSFIKATKEIFPNADALLIVGGVLLRKLGDHRLQPRIDAQQRFDLSRSWFLARARESGDELQRLALYCDGLGRRQLRNPASRMFCTRQRIVERPDPIEHVADHRDARQRMT